MRSSASGRFLSRKVNASGLQRSNQCMHFCSHMNFYTFTLTDDEFATFSLLAKSKMSLYPIQGRVIIYSKNKIQS